MIKLTLTEKGGEPRVLTFDKDEITIGRVSGNDIVLAKGNISKRHSRLTMRDGAMEIADMKSTNGTYVNGRKIAGPTPIASTDRIYVGDFLIGIDGPAGAMAEPGGLPSPASSASSGSASRRMPVPPPPPPPARGGSSASRLPAEDDEDSSGAEDEEEAGLAARPPRAGRAIPPPPPPPPPRRPTPMASESLGLDELDDAFPPPSDAGPQNLEDTGNIGLFQHPRRGEEDGDASRRVPTGNRPGVGGGVVAQAPAFGGMTGPVASSPADMTGGGAASGLEALLS